jgi:hypothetical protein
MTNSNVLITILLLALSALSFSLKVGQSHTWKGYSPQCDQDCNKVGEVCDIGK